MKKVNRFMEYFWLVVAVATLGLALWAIANTSLKDAWTWLLFPLFALLMYGVRRFLRSKLEAMEERDRAAAVKR